MSAQPIDESCENQGKTQRPNVEQENPFGARIRRLNTEILPSAPYLLRLSQHAGRRAHSQGAPYSWNTGNLFETHEQELQYMSFRRMDDAPMLHAHGQWDDGNGGIAPPEDPASQTSSNRTPLAGSGLKKKITLADYKNRDKKKSVDIETKASEFGNKSETRLRDDETKATEPSKSAEKSRVAATAADPKSEPQSEVPLQKRIDEAVSSKGARQVSDLPDPAQTLASAQLKEPPLHSDLGGPLPKSALESAVEKSEGKVEAKTRSAVPRGPLSKENGHVEATESLAKAALPKSKQMDFQGVGSVSRPLPPMLSPTLPAQLNEDNKPPFVLPKMLSPTLPKGLEAEVVKIRRQQGNIQGTSGTSNSSSSIKVKQNSRSNTESSKANLKTHSSTIAPSSQRNQDRHQLPTSAPRQHIPASSAPNGLHASKSTSSGVQKKTLTVKLNIKNKSRRKRLGDYLRLKPTPGKQLWSGLKADQSGEERATSLAGGKRRRSRGDSDAPERPAKRPSWLPQKPTTPALPASSPAPSLPGSAQKAHLIAPTGDLKSSAVQRVGSEQGGAPTPKRHSREATPNPPGTGRDSPAKEKKAAYRAEASRYITLATELKHDCDKYLKVVGEISKEEKKLMIVVGTESVLCYMLASAIYDEPSKWDRLPGNSNLWKSIIGFLNVINQASSRPSQQLSGLLFQLEGIIRDTLQVYDTMNFNLTLREYSRTEATKSETATEADYTKIIEHYHRLHKDERENQVKAAEAWAQGHLALYLDDLMTDFPRTFAHRRRRSGLGKGMEAVHLKEYKSNGYSIPMNQLTSPLEAVNLGLDLLAEFSEKEGLKWKPKLVLEEKDVQVNGVC